MPDIDQPLATSRILRWSIWIALAALAAAGFLHLGADFPNYSRWSDDAAKYADEGWWASGALNHILLGHWIRPGEFTPVVIIPVWSVLLEAVFHFTGISIVLARALAFVFTLGTVILAGSLMARDHRPLAPAFMLLMLSSPLLYTFSRLAILEPPLLFFLVAAVLAAYGRTPLSAPRLILCGTLFTLAVLTKSSAIFAAPAFGYLLWFPLRHQPARAMRAAFIAGATALILYGAYWFLVVHTHPEELRTFFAENRLHLELKSFEKAVRIVFRSFTWIDPVFFPVAVLGVLASFGRLRTLWNDPLFGFSIVFYIGYSGFLLLHFDAGPRYFAVLVFPVMLIVLLFQQALQREIPALGTLLNFVIVATVCFNIVHIGRLFLHPTYSLRDADLAIRRQIDADPSVNRLVIGRGAIQSTYLTKIPALDEMGYPVAQKLATDHPGWAVIYSDDYGMLTMPGVAEHYTFVEKGKYRVFEDSPRGYLLLYRISEKQK